MRYRLARITLAAALVAGAAPMLATSASADMCSDPDSCMCVQVGGQGPCFLNDSVNIFLHPRT